eukprot:4825907-Pyramimonas_sp.AAC.1
MAVIGSTYEPKEVLVISSPTSSTTDLRTTGTARQQPTCLEPGNESVRFNRPSMKTLKLPSYTTITSNVPGMPSSLRVGLCWVLGSRTESTSTALCMGGSAAPPALSIRAVGAASWKIQWKIQSQRTKRVKGYEGQPCMGREPNAQFCRAWVESRVLSLFTCVAVAVAFFS